MTYYIRNSGKSWTSQDNQTLRQLAAKNTPTRVAAFKLGRTPDAVYSQASKLNISLDPPNQSPYNRRAK